MNGLIRAFVILIQAVSANCYAPGDFCQSINNEIAFDSDRAQFAQSLMDFNQWTENIIYPILIEVGAPTGNDFDGTPDYAYLWARIIQHKLYDAIEWYFWPLFDYTFGGYIA